MHLRLCFSITFVIYGKFIRPILQFFGLFAKEVISNLKSSKKQIALQKMS